MEAGGDGPDRNPEVLLASLRAAWERHPDWRIGQIIVNALRGTPYYPDPFYIENDELAERVDAL